MPITDRPSEEFMHALTQGERCPYETTEPASIEITINDVTSTVSQRDAVTAQDAGSSLLSFDDTIAFHNSNSFSDGIQRAQLNSDMINIPELLARPEFAEHIQRLVSEAVTQQLRKIVEALEGSAPAGKNPRGRVVMLDPIVEDNQS